MILYNSAQGSSLGSRIRPSRRQDQGDEEDAGGHLHAGPSRVPDELEDK